MRKLLYVLITFIIILVVTGAYVFSSRSPYIAIRKHLFIIDPVQAVTCNIQPTAIYDFEQGHPFIIYGFAEKPMGPEIHTIYTKSNKIGLWYVYSMHSSY